ncbi:NUDIX hydrolase [Chungangia koreensis]|uniref:NUDIX hydrolase n=1 Tax=Chungangia koreensis TaxID=752657 RepID=A0ABV8X5M5_9LACT
MNYPNYRISVELIFKNEGKVLLTKRSENSTVAPGVWNVPAGKVKYEEIPIQAVYREALEETGLKLCSVEEVSVRNQSWESRGEIYYRVIFTYIVEAAKSDYTRLKLNDEHTEYAWVNLDELSHEKYDSLHPELRKIIASIYE